MGPVGRTYLIDRFLCPLFVNENPAIVAGFYVGYADEQKKQIKVITECFV